MELTEKSFYDTVTGDGKKVVQFTATWCGPCRFLAPTLEKLSEEAGFDYFKVDVDRESQLARDFSIMSIPTVQVYEDGKLINTFVGMKNGQALKLELGLTD